MTRRTAIIIGAGPAGLTAARELQRRTDIRPIVLEASEDVGGISRTINHKGNRIDIGGHRFFSKSDRVMRWWLDILPIQRLAADEASIAIAYQNKERAVAVGDGPDPDAVDDVMLVRHRVSRILYGGKLFEYPLTLSPDTVSKLGYGATARMGMSYMRSMVAPIRPERSLEDFFINRFGRELYQRFFREYTEKVWGMPCDQISPEWGAQRVKGLSISRVIGHAVKKAFARPGDIAQRATETSLIERFLYPKFGPGQMWSNVARQVTENGGELHFGAQAVAIRHDGAHVSGVSVRDARSGETREITGDFVFSTMPVKELVAGMNGHVPDRVRDVADGLMYRDFITVGLLVDKLKLGGGVDAASLSARVPDNWIYIQEPSVKLGRLQIFNNWSPYMVADRSKIWIGLEYFCSMDDELWSLSDQALLDLAVEEVERIGIVPANAVKDRMVARIPKAYPGYFGTYERFDEIREWLDGIDNLFLIGRNGMHRYNNQDHSMLAAMTSVDNIVAKRQDKANIWSVNAEQEYHEEK